MARLRTLLLPALMLVVCGCAVPRAVTAPPHPSEPTVPVYLVSHDWHTGIVIRRPDIPAGLWPEAGDFPGTEHLEVGWGDRAYYQVRDPGLWTTLTAARRSTRGSARVHNLNYHQLAPSNALLTRRGCASC